MATTPLTVLDLVPISSGSSPAEALQNTIALARATESFGYYRYWFAEHHLNPGVAGTSPAVVLALTADATSTIRIGSGAVQLGPPHRAVHRGGVRAHRRAAPRPARPWPRPVRRAAAAAAGPPGPQDREPALVGAARQGDAAPGNRWAPNGLLIPPKFSVEKLLGSPRFRMQKTLLQLPGASPQDYGEQVADILALLHGTYRSPDGVEGRAIPGEGANLQVWILGSSGGQSATVAGENGLRFASNYHVSPATVLEAVEGYRAAFRPSADLERPLRQRLGRRRGGEGRGDGARARNRLRPVGAQHPLRRGRDPVPDPAAGPGAHLDRRGPRPGRRPGADPVRRVAGQVADKLEQLQEATGADELIITTITHDPADRVRSYRLLADEWHRR